MIDAYKVIHKKSTHVVYDKIISLKTKELKEGWKTKRDSVNEIDVFP